MWGERIMRAVWVYKARWSRTRSEPPIRSKPAPSSRSSRPSRRRNRSVGYLGLGVLGRLLGILDDERLEGGAQEARADGRPADADDVRQVEVALAELAGHRAADVRVLERRRRHIAGVELVRRTLMVPFLVGHGPHQGDLVHDLGRMVPALRDRDAGDGRRDRPGFPAVLGSWLGVEGLELARSAGHPEQDARHLPLPDVGGMEGHPVGEAQRHGPRRRQTRRPQSDRPEEMPAPDHPLAAHRHVHQLAFHGHGYWPRSAV